MPSKVDNGLKEISSLKKMTVLINSEAGSAEKASIVSGAFEEAGIEAQLKIIRPGRLNEELSRIVRSDAEAVCVGGGDGTIRAAAGFLYKTNIALGVLPFGTLNHFAQDLGIPMDPLEAVRSLIRGTAKFVDIGSVNGHIFVNNASIGIYPEAVRKRADYQLKLGISKYFAMTIALAGILWDLPAHRLGIRGEDVREQIETPFLMVGNNRYRPEFLSVAQRDSLSEGLFSVWYAQKASRPVLFLSALKALLGRVDEAPSLQTIDTAELIVESHRSRMRTALDGEVLMIKPALHFRILPKSLKIIAPGFVQ